MLWRCETGCGGVNMSIISELTREKEALLNHLHLVQEELERLYAQRQRGDTQSGTDPLHWYDDEWAGFLAESQRLQAISDILLYRLPAESSNSLASRIGAILLQSMKSSGSLLAQYGALRKIKRLVSGNTPPEIWGGKTFDKVIAAYEQGDMEAVESLLDRVVVSPAVRANAYTALARHLLQHDMYSKTVDVAKRAYETDPRPHRLKWLGFRLYDAGSVVEAEAVFTVLPINISMSESETQYVNRLRSEAKRIREGAVRQQSAYKTLRETTEQRFRDVALGKEQAERLAAKKAAEVEQLLAVQSALERDMATVTEQRFEQATLAAERAAEIERLLLAQATHEEQIAALERQKAEQVELRLEQANLLSQRQAELLQNARDLLTLEQEKSTLISRVRELESHVVDLARIGDEQALLANKKLSALTVTLHEQKGAIESLLQKQSGELAKMRNVLGRSIKQEILAAIHQVESSFVLQQYFSTGKLAGVSLGRDSWPVASDFALYLVECIEQLYPDVIIEFGSGISTTVIARTIANIRQRHPERPVPDVVSFDHKEYFYQHTQTLLKSFGLLDVVRLFLAPLQEYTAPDGMSYPYYACQSILEALAASHSHKKLVVLAVVDGPPEDTGTHARYPAFPVVMQHFSGMHVNFLLDDYSREDEKEIVGLWQTECSNAGWACTVIEKQLTRGACLLSVVPSDTE